MTEASVIAVSVAIISTSGVIYLGIKQNKTANAANTISMEKMIDDRIKLLLDKYDTDLISLRKLVSELQVTVRQLQDDLAEESERRRVAEQYLEVANEQLDDAKKSLDKMAAKLETVQTELEGERRLSTSQALQITELELQVRMLQSHVEEIKSQGQMGLDI